uniref:Uncharacterized protein n=1 Tax=Octopus bimaculoides TaxID=37653 RepID=A0A0L8H159_OCTBM
MQLLLSETAVGARDRGSCSSQKLQVDCYRKNMDNEKTAAVQHSEKARLSLAISAESGEECTIWVMRGKISCSLFEGLREYYII